MLKMGQIKGSFYLKTMGRFKVRDTVLVSFLGKLYKVGKITSDPPVLRCWALALAYVCKVNYKFNLQTEIKLGFVSVRVG
jgi:hypothetical protein